jgi:ribonucleoside-diphosphate reductase alpha chain
MEHYAWTVALTRMISAVFRRGGDVSFVVEELKAVFDPRGGQWMDGRYVPSLLAAIGEVIERHMIDIGFVRPGGALPSDPYADVGLVPADVMAEGAPPEIQALGAPQAASGVASRPRFSAVSGGAAARMRSCPKCSAPSLIRQEGCDTCTSCGYSKCA